ncbi:hypothetical protein PtA15_8A519 [Puccinia triticina]|uniref:Uncharacterized protein n=1 Tax=Puccinia triticina TaxID=208348 RepID=A0ABY7CQR9_9BASI|nr:uncharacterized protein PtA15_8A519 [Puccinia triticina]WAQ87614.1 hypothetical protein PtA15_8A519 [Puccinia triticina]
MAETNQAGEKTLTSSSGWAHHPRSSPEPGPASPAGDQPRPSNCISTETPTAMGLINLNEDTKVELHKTLCRIIIHPGKYEYITDPTIIIQERVNQVTAAIKVLALPS